nr:uncharacterized protein LOC105849733 [Hydra vulgaris]
MFMLLVLTTFLISTNYPLNKCMAMSSNDFTDISKSDLDKVRVLVETLANSEVVIGATEVFKAGKVFLEENLQEIKLAIDAIKSIKRWWKNEISGALCAKLLVDDYVKYKVAAFSGTACAFTFGSLFGPVGAAVGGVGCMIVGGAAAHAFSDRLTEWLFGVSREVALENAYKFFNLKSTASNKEINYAFNQLCKKFDPKSGGNEDEYYFVQVNMAIIKGSKNNL